MQRREKVKKGKLQERCQSHRAALQDFMLFTNQTAHLENMLDKSQCAQATITSLNKNALATALILKGTIKQGASKFPTIISVNQCPESGGQEESNSDDSEESPIEKDDK